MTIPAPTRVSALLAATALVCATELAALLAALSSGRPPEVVALLLGAFHLGYLAADPLWRRWQVRWRTLALTTSLCAASLCYLQFAGSPYPAALALFAFNSIAQAHRRAWKSTVQVSSRPKNIAKATGIIAGGVLGTVPLGPLFLLMPLVMLTISTGATSSHERPRDRPAAHPPRTHRDRLLLWGELVHHAHYFTYCYVFWYLAPSLISVWSGVWFLLGWMAYFVTERTWRERRQVFAPRAIAAGHIVVAGALLVMTHLSAPGILAAWFITGIGGGTAYMLGNAGHQGPRERFEDSGHVAGIAVAGVVVSFAGANYDAAVAALHAAAGLAVCAAMIFLAVPTHPQNRPSEPIGDPECV